MGNRYFRFQQTFGNDHTSIRRRNIYIGGTSWNWLWRRCCCSCRTQSSQIFAGDWSISATTLTYNKNRVSVGYWIDNSESYKPSNRNCCASAKRLAIGLAYTLGPRCSTAVNPRGATGSTGGNTVTGIDAGVGAAPDCDDGATGFGVADPIQLFKLFNWREYGIKHSVKTHRRLWNQWIWLHPTHFQQWYRLICQ